MTWSAPTNVGSGGGSTSATSQSITGVTAAAGTFIVVEGAFNSSSTVTGATFSDSAGGNSWTVRAAKSGTQSSWGFIAYCILTNAISSGSLTITRGGTGNINSWSMKASAWTGGAASSIENTAVLATATGTSASPAVTGNAASQSGDLLVAVCAFFPASSTTYTEDTGDGWTNIVNNLDASGFAAVSSAYQVNAGTSGIRHAPTLSKSQPWIEVQVGFLAGSSASVTWFDSGSDALRPSSRRLVESGSWFPLTLFEQHHAPVIESGPSAVRPRVRPQMPPYGETVATRLDASAIAPPAPDPKRPSAVARIADNSSVLPPLVVPVPLPAMGWFRDSTTLVRATRRVYGDPALAPARIDAPVVVAPATDTKRTAFVARFADSRVVLPPLVVPPPLPAMGWFKDATTTVRARPRVDQDLSVWLTGTRAVFFLDPRFCAIAEPLNFAAAAEQALFAGTAETVSFAAS